MVLKKVSKVKVPKKDRDDVYRATQQEIERKKAIRRIQNGKA